MGPKATLKQVPRISAKYEMVHPVSAQTDAEGCKLMLKDSERSLTIVCDGCAEPMPLNST
jgi:hypothetical protein